MRWGRLSVAAPCPHLLEAGRDATAVVVDDRHRAGRVGAAHVRRHPVARPRENRIWGGRTTYRLRRIDGTLKLAFKKVQLVDADKPIHTLSYLI